MGSLYGGSGYGGNSGFSASGNRRQFPNASYSSAFSSAAPKQEKGTSTTAGDGKKVAVGGKVKHGAFGEGTITAVAGSGDSCKITVVFNNRVSRTFMLKFAPLEIL